jgi:hypothetical protein
MTSQINPNNIDGTYPIAGQDNSTQGFRDNFTNIKLNFQYAAQEITALQGSALVGGTGEENYLDGALLYDGNIQDFSATRLAWGQVSGSVAINYSSGHYQTLELSGSTTLSFVNFPAVGKQGWLTLVVTVPNTAYTLTLPNQVGTGASSASIRGIQGISGRTITFAETGTYEFQFHSDDQGASIYLSELTRPRNRFINPLFLTGSEDLAPSAAASLTKTTSYFSTAGAETATLAAGTEGQIKIFAMSGFVGNMVITVTNAGWKSSGTGTITFNAIGDTCILMYINSKWYPIGSNSVTFA